MGEGRGCCDLVALQVNGGNHLDGNPANVAEDRIEDAFNVARRCCADGRVPNLAHIGFGQEPVMSGPNTRVHAVFLGVGETVLVTNERRNFFPFAGRFRKRESPLQCPVANGGQSLQAEPGLVLGDGGAGDLIGPIVVINDVDNMQTEIEDDGGVVVQAVGPDAVLANPKVVLEGGYAASGIGDLDPFL